MQIKVFQVNPDRDPGRIKFMDSEFIEKSIGLNNLSLKYYDLAFSGSVSCSNLEGVYSYFNRGFIDSFTGHSVSVSDIVQIISVDADEAPGYYLCDAIGWKRLSLKQED